MKDCIENEQSVKRSNANAEVAGILARIDELEERLRVAEAKETIRYKLCMYSRGDDRLDENEGFKAFAPNCIADYGTSPEFGSVFKGNGRDFVKSCIKTDRGLLDGGSFYAHVINNIAITVNGNKAGSETYGTVPVLFSNSFQSSGDDLGGAPDLGDADPNGYTMGQTVARYCDKWECIDGDWLIVERHVTNDFGWRWSGVNLIAPYDGTTDKNDPSYEALNYGRKVPEK